MTLNFLFILGISLLAYSVGDPLCGPDSCNDLTTVKSCKNVDYCISDVWSKNVPSGSKDNVCDICLNMVEEARKQLQSNETMSELQQVLEGNCNLMMLNLAKRLCKRLAHEFVPELVKLLLSEMDPETVCTISKLCNNPELRELQIKSSGCVKCQQFFISAADVVLKSPEWVLQNQYTDICRAMGSYSDACLYYLLKNYSAIDGHVKSALQQQMCEVAKLCPIGSTYTIEKALNKLPPQTWKESKNRMCSVCPAFMKNLHLIFREMKTQDQLQNWVVHFCTSLSLPEEFCTKFVTEHYKLILSYFKHNTSYEYICTRGIGLCEYETEIPPIWSLFPVTNSTEKPEKVEKETSANEIKKVETTPLNKEKKFKISWGDALPGPLEMLPVNRFIGSGGECQACTNMFSTVSQYMLTHQDYVNSILNSTCHSTKDYDTCLTFVKKYGHLLKDSAHISPKSVCPTLVPFCDGMLSEEILLLTQNSEENCDFCVSVFDSLNSNDKTKAAQIQLKKGLKESCKKVPSESQNVCKEIAENFLKNMVASVTSDMSSTDTCNYLKLCQPQTKRVEPEETSSVYCKDCMLMIEILYEEINTKSSEEEIRHLLSKACNKLPSKSQGFCEMIVENYVDELITFLKDNLSPSVICQKLHLCNEHAEKVPAVSKKGTEVNLKDAKVPCNFCLTVLKMIQNNLDSNSTEAEIKKYLDKVCTYVPDEAQDMCRTLINQYSEELIDMILADFNATEICIYLKLCGPKSEIFRKTSEITPKSHLNIFEKFSKNNPVAACNHCRLYESSMAVKGEGDQAAKDLYDMLTEICVTNPSSVVGECTEKVLKEILPNGPGALTKIPSICTEMKICPQEGNFPEVDSDKKLIDKIHKAVQECAMCEAVVGIVSAHIKLKTGKYDFATNPSAFCSPVPWDQMKTCKSMLVSYAPSIYHLLTVQKVQPDDVCFHLTLCEKGAQTKVNMPVTSIEQSGNNRQESGNCLQGPSFWCSNVENAIKCGTLLHCREMVWKGKSP